MIAVTGLVVGGAPGNGRSTSPVRLTVDRFECRSGCGACCIAPSISSAIPGMPDGKPAGVRCIHLTPDSRCAIFDHPDRPAVCGSLQPSLEMCGEDAANALASLAMLERQTRPVSEPR